MQLAINAFDVMRLDPHTRALLLAGKVKNKAIRVDHSELAVEFTCDLLEASCIVDTIRRYDLQAGDTSVTRAYKSIDGKRWTKLPGNKDLSIRIGLDDSARPMLNPEVFGKDMIAPDDIEPLQPEAVFGE